jgi:hypothetical protein
MYVGVEFKFEGLNLVSPFWIGGDSPFEFSAGPPSLDHSNEFRVASQFIVSLARLRALSCNIACHWRSEGLRGRTRDWGGGAGFEEAEEAPDEVFKAVEYNHREHRYFGLSLEDLLPIGSVRMSSVPGSISHLCYMCWSGRPSAGFIPLLYGLATSFVAPSRILHAVLRGLCRICKVRVEFVVQNVSCMLVECNACMWWRLLRVIVQYGQ